MRTICLLFAVAVGFVPAAAQPSLPLLERLEGDWVGQGDFSGSPATFEMSWQAILNGSWVKLEYAGYRNSGTVRVPIIRSQAFYGRTSESASKGMWFDDRGVALPLSFEVDEHTLSVLWGDDNSSQRGRTTYRIEENGRLTVIDEFLAATGYAVFARGTFERNPGL